MRHGKRGFRFDKMLRAAGPFMMAAAVGGMMAGKRNGKFNFNCDSDNFRFNGKTGVKLDDLDMGDDAPDEVVLVGPDHVVISEGEDFTISLQGDDETKEGVRFLVEEDTLYILRDDLCGPGEDRATISVTMPAPSKITIAGAGELATSTLAKEAEVLIAGAGQLSVLDIDIDELDVTIAGSGHFTAGGKVEELELSVAGSGIAEMSGLMVGKAGIDIAGSGNSTFACDGEVEAHIMGSGNVTVRGSARCRVQSMGAGCLVCEPREDKTA